MPGRCSVYSCTNAKKPGSDITLHRLPLKDATILTEWLVRISRGYPKGRIWQPTLFSKICNVHFSECDYIVGHGSHFLKREAVPSRNLGYPMSAEDCIQNDIAPIRDPVVASQKTNRMNRPGQPKSPRQKKQLLNTDLFSGPIPERQLLTLSHSFSPHCNHFAGKRHPAAIQKGNTSSPISQPCVVDESPMDFWSHPSRDLVLLRRAIAYNPWKVTGSWKRLGEAMRLIPEFSHCTTKELRDRVEFLLSKYRAGEMHTLNRPDAHVQNVEREATIKVVSDNERKYNIFGQNYTARIQKSLSCFKEVDMPKVYEAELVNTDWVIMKGDAYKGELPDFKEDDRMEAEDNQNENFVLTLKTNFEIPDVNDNDMPNSVLCSNSSGTVADSSRSGNTETKKCNPISSMPDRSRSGNTETKKYSPISSIPDRSKNGNTETKKYSPISSIPDRSKNGNMETKKYSPISSMPDRSRSGNTETKKYSPISSMQLSFLKELSSVVGDFNEEDAQKFQKGIMDLAQSMRGEKIGSNSAS